MKDKEETKTQILKELHRLRRENDRLKEAERQWKKTKKALAEAEQKLDLAIRGSKSGLWEMFIDPADPANPVLKKIYLSPQSKALIGYEDHELPNSIKAWAKRILPEDLPLVQNKAKAYLAGNIDSHEVEYRIRHKNGGIRWHRIYGRSQTDAHGTPLRLSGTVWDITERKQAEIALKESEGRYRELFNNMKSGVAVYKAKNDGEDFIFIDFNEPGERIESVKKQDLIDKTVLETFSGIKELGLFDVLQRVWKTGEPERHSNGFYQDDRIKGWRENYVYKLPSGEIVAVYDDITERKRAEIARKESEERFRDLARFLPETIFEMDRRGTLTFVNEKAFARFGYTRRDFEQGLKGLDMIAPQDREKAARNIQAVLSGQDLGLNEYAALRMDGSTFPVLMHSTPIIRNGEAVGVRGFIIDISEWKKVEEALQKSEEKYRFVAEKATDVIWQADMEGNFQFLSPAFERLTGWSLEEGLSLNLKDVMAPDSYELTSKALAKKIATTGNLKNTYIPPLILPLKSLRKDGSSFLGEVSMKLLRDGEGQPIGLTGITRDVTERKRAEDALKKLARDLRKRVKELNCLYSVSNFLGETGKFHDETLYSIVRLLPTAFLYPEKTCARIKLGNRNFETDNFKETAHKLASDIATAQGEPIGVMEIFFMEEISGADGRPFLKEEMTLVDAISNRISDWLEKKRAEKEKQKVEVQLRQAQKMEALGTLAGGIAHDFNNILAVIMGHTEIALEKAKIGEDDTMETSRVLEAAVRASNLVKQILTFSRKVETEL